MPQKDFDDLVISEHGTWNVAAHYSELKIMRPLALADEYETIAEFGYLEFEDELQSTIDEEVLKIKGFRRLIKILILLINNSKFVITGKHFEELIKYKKELNRFYKIIPELFKQTKNERTKMKKINIIYDKYNLALGRVSEIKSLINVPLNKFDLIFTFREPFDVKKVKEIIKKGLIERG